MASRTKVEFSDGLHAQHIQIGEKMSTSEAKKEKPEQEKAESATVTEKEYDQAGILVIQVRGLKK